MPEKIKTTHRRAIAAMNVLQSLRETQGAENIRYPYAIAKNIRLLEQHMASLRDIAKPDSAYVAFDSERVGLNVKYCQMDGRGRPRVVNNNYVIDPEKQVDFDVELIALKERHHDAIAAHEMKQKSVEAMLDNECEIDVYIIKLSWVPNNAKPGDVEVLMDFIEDDLPG